MRLTYQGRDIQPTLNLLPTAANLKHAARQRVRMVEEIKAGTFMVSAYFPDYKHLGHHDGGHARTLRDWAEVWAKLAARDLEHSSLTIYVRHLEAYWLKPFGGMLPGQVTYEKVLGHLAELAAGGLSRKTQNNILIPLRGVYKLICKDSNVKDPTDGIENLKVQVGDPDPFTAEEVDIALAYIRKHEGNSWADYFAFAAFAGLRPSEQTAILWADLDLRTGTCVVRRARVLGEDKERTKTTSQRTVEFNDLALAVLERQRARTQMLGGEVFVNPSTNRPFVDEQCQARVWQHALRMCQIRHRPPKELRDTSVSQALMKGCDPYWVAAQHGHNVTTMSKSYAKFIPKADGGRNLAKMNQPDERSLRKS